MNKYIKHNAHIVNTHSIENSSETDLSKIITQNLKKQELEEELEEELEIVQRKKEEVEKLKLEK